MLSDCESSRSVRGVLSSFFFFFFPRRAPPQFSPPQAEHLDYCKRGNSGLIQGCLILGEWHAHTRRHAGPRLWAFATLRTNEPWAKNRKLINAAPTTTAWFFLSPCGFWGSFLPNKQWLYCSAGGGLARFTTCGLLFLRNQQLRKIDFCGIHRHMALPFFSFGVNDDIRIN